MTLARQARALGIDMRVCAPGLIPRKPTDRIKTDARDAEHLARQLAAAACRSSRPDRRGGVAARPGSRSRGRARRPRRARHRLSKFLLRRDLRYSDSGAWTRNHLHWISQQTFDDRSAQMTCAEYLNAVRVLVARRDLLERPSTRCSRRRPTPTRSTGCDLPRDRHPDRVRAVRRGRRLRALRQARPAMRLPGHRPLRAHDRQQAPAGSITKAGSSHARRLLVEAAWHYRRPPRVGVTLERRQRDIDPRVVAIAWRCQQRLYDRHRKLRDERRKPAGVVNIACARELACFVWEAATID